MLTIFFLSNILFIINITWKPNSDCSLSLYTVSISLRRDLWISCWLMGPKEDGRAVPRISHASLYYFLSEVY